MQLVAYGAQDVYLTGNPQITFFKVVYRRHTNFSMEAIQQTFSGTSTVTSQGRSDVTISRNGDLISKIYACFKVPSGATALQGSRLFKTAELEIGGQRIDRHYEEWNQVWNELTTPESKAAGLKAMTGDLGMGGNVDKVQVPFNFWFCRNPGLALPLIALQYHEVKLILEQGTSAAVSGTPPLEVWVDYIYLDTDERRRFAQVSHEYLIEQLQNDEKSVTGGQGAKIQLNFNHPVKELIWTYQPDRTMSAVTLKLNGHDRFSQQTHEEYFTLRQPFDYHTAVPRQNLPLSSRVKLNEVGAELQHPAKASKTVTAAAAASTGNVQIADGVPTTFTMQHAADVTDMGIVAGSTLQLIITKNSATGVKVGGVGVGNGAGIGNLFTAFVSAVPTTTTLTLVEGFKNSSGGILTSFATDGTNNGGVLSVLDTKVQTTARTSALTNKVACYSFGLKPEEHQPSGTCNFSRIDNAELSLQLNGSGSTTVTIYAVNYNVLRIMSGMGGLAYSN